MEGSRLFHTTDNLNRSYLNNFSKIKKNGKTTICSISKMLCL